MKVRVALIGHVDHGKSTVIGRLLTDTGQASEDRKERVRATCESSGHRFEYAFLLDALEEEQAQGITIDVTEVNWAHGGREFVFVDTPGHREFLKKMVGGASRVDSAIVVVDALEGISDSFRRQMHVLDLLGVHDRIILLNKMDLANWQEKIWKKRRREIFDAGFPSARANAVIPVAAWSGENLIARSSRMPWYDGPTLADALLTLRGPSGEKDAPLRFFVQDVYREEARRILVGRVESGVLSEGQKIRFFPGNRETIVKSLEFFGEERSSASEGDSVGLTLADPLYLDRGAIGHSRERAPKVASRVTADLFWLDPSGLRQGERLTVKAGTQTAEAWVEEIESEIDSETFVLTEKASQISAFGRIRLRFKTPWAFDLFEDCPATGRFVAMKDSHVVGGGRWVAAAEPKISPSDLPRGLVLWMSGLSGAGKSTIAREIRRRLQAKGVRASILDGDQIRQGLSRDLGFSMEDRAENLRRASEVAKLMADAGLVVIAAFISPLGENRSRAREIIGSDSFREIFVDCPLEECEARDPKGLYARARKGLLSGMTGIDSPFERPRNPDLVLNTAERDLDSSVGELEQLVDSWMENQNRKGIAP